jgi:ATP-dependent helicase HrpB
MPTPLPIDNHRQEITSAIDAHGLVVAEAPTGSGKSTRIPIWLEELVQGQIVIVQPRRVAARSLAGFLASERNEPIGKSVGYRVRFDDRSSNATRLLFATPGVVLRMLRADIDRWPAAVILDEFHERSLEVDLCAAILLAARRNGRTTAPLVLTSATLDGRSLSEQIGAAHITAEGRTYPVHITHTEDISSPSAQDLEDRVGTIVRKVLRDQEGDVLVFLPGKGEIDRCRETCARGAPRGVEILPFHANLNSDAIDRIFQPTTNRRVFLATNVAETSLTLPGVRTVIDAGLVRQIVHRGGRSALALMPTSEASLDQRSGRAGRTAPGECIRLFSSGYRPQATDRPEIERLELDDLVVQAAACGLCGNDLIEAPWVTPPPEFAIERSLTTMTSRGVLDETGALSERGRKLADLPISASVARAVLDAPTELKGAVADVVALVERGEGLLRFPMGGGAHLERIGEARAKLLDACKSDVEAGIRLLRRGHAGEHGLSRSTLDDTRRTASVLRRLIESPHSRPEDDNLKIDTEGLARHLLSRIPDQAFVLRPRALKKSRSPRSRTLPYANGEIELGVEPWSDGERASHPLAGLILSVFWSESSHGRGVFGRGNLLLPCQLGWLAEAGLGETSIGKVKATRPSGEIRIVAEVQRTLAEVVLSSTEEVLRGEMAIDAAAGLIAEGRLLKPAAELLSESLHLAEVAYVLRLTRDRLDVDDVKAAAQQRLVDLGVREAADLPLVDPEDLDLDLPAALQMDAEELRSIGREFPRIWINAGVEHRVLVERTPAAEVILEVERSKSSAKIKPPPPGQIPNFRGLPVRWRKASRTVRIR